jgi:hypothetical protein
LLFVCRDSKRPAADPVYFSRTFKRRGKFSFAEEPRQLALDRLGDREAIGMREPMENKLSYVDLDCFGI